jgi:type I site-specific restriction endonuclease
MIIILSYLYANFKQRMNLQKLNFPDIEARFNEKSNGQKQLFDGIRKKFVDLTPEEWVRQHVVSYLIHFKATPSSLISVEKQLVLNGTKRRTDVVVYNSALSPLLIIECKAPNVLLNQETVNQALGYNLVLNVPFVLLTNGLSHICLHFVDQKAVILSEIPSFEMLQNNT